MIRLPEYEFACGSRRAIVTQLPDGSAELKWTGGPPLAFAEHLLAEEAARNWVFHDKRPRVPTQRGLGAVLRADRVEVRT